MYLQLDAALQEIDEESESVWEYWHTPSPILKLAWFNKLTDCSLLNLHGFLLAHTWLCDGKQNAPMSSDPFLTVRSSNESD